jgi:hypothetical protein
MGDFEIECRGYIKINNLKSVGAGIPNEIAGGNILMNNIVLVNGRQATGGLKRQPYELFQGKRGLFEMDIQADALNILQDKQGAVLLFNPINGFDNLIAIDLPEKVIFPAQPLRTSPGM